MCCVRFPLSLRQVEDILQERGIDICHETVRFWWYRFETLRSKEIRRSKPNSHSLWRWHLDEVFVKIHGKRVYQFIARTPFWIVTSPRGATAAQRLS